MAKKNKNEIPEENLNEAKEAEAAEAKTAQAEAEVSSENFVEKEKFLRLAAEYDNFRKRSQKEREALYADVRADTIAKILPVYDNLARALKQETADAAFYKGVEMTMAQLKEIFEKLGIKEIEALGKTFDPAYHNAVMHVDDDSFGESEIVEEFEKGFIMGEKIIRFSVVKVAN